jgi:iron complex outermembrane receptor protein
MRERSFLSCVVVCVTAAVLMPGFSPTIAAASPTQAQVGSVRVEVVEAGMPVGSATVMVGTTSATTDPSGIAIVNVPAGSVRVIADKSGYEAAVAGVDVVSGEERRVRLVLLLQPTGEEPSVVTSTRVPRRIEEQAMPVELIERREVEQQMLMTPGNIATLLDATRSVRMQITSPELGMAAPRIRGLRGHYTRLLTDGVHLDFDHPGGLAPMQILPMDVAQIEVLPDGASALFGANALGGAVNLVSRRPGLARERELLFSQSAPDATDAALFISLPAKGSWSSTWLVSGHRQDERDVDDDGWSDNPGYSRGTVRTRVLWDNRQGRSASGVANVTFEKRKGGSAFAHQDMETKEADGALFGAMPLGKYILAGAGTLFVQSRTRDFSDAREHERRQSATMELTLRGRSAAHSWLAGITSDWFAIRSKTGIASQYVSTRPGMFVHDDIDVASWLVVSGSARLDHHNKYGMQLSPRGSALVHRGPWSARVSAGRSYFAPTPLTEETEAAGLTRLTLDEPLENETARSVSADLTHTTPSSVLSVTFFHTHVDSPALVDRTTYTLRTDDSPLVSRGTELVGTVRGGGFALTGTYAYVRARERDDRREVALTPRYSGSVMATASSDAGRIGLQVHFTGEQRLDANPYRSSSEAYTVVHLLSELPLGRWRLFVHAENLGDVRQTNWDPIARPTRDVDGRWTVDAWAPLRGRSINAGIKVPF